MIDTATRHIGFRCVVRADADEEAALATAFSESWLARKRTTWQEARGR